MKTTVGIIGTGNMGAAIWSGIHRRYSVLVCEQDSRRRAFLRRKFRLVAKDLKTVVEKTRVIILAVKPQDFDAVLSEVGGQLTKDRLVISIAAGITCGYIEKKVGKRTRVIRAMPNLPAQVGDGVTGIARGKAATKQDLNLARAIFDCVGITVVCDEKWMDAVTAVSGSGPAYVFLFAECFEKAACSLGLSREFSRRLVGQTLKGSLNLLEKSGGGAHALRARVTSKGGTTQAALKVFEKGRFEKIFKEALEAAQTRAKELSK